MGGGDLAVFILDQVEMLDQQVAIARPVPEQILDLLQSLAIDLPPFGCGASTLAPLARVGEGLNLLIFALIHRSPRGIPHLVVVWLLSPCPDIPSPVGGILHTC